MSHYYLTASLWFGLSLFSIPQLFSQTFVLNKDVDSTMIQTGREFVYTLQYTCASTTQNCENVVLLDTLPLGVEFVSFVDNPLHSSNTSYDASTRIVTFELNNENGTGMNAGSTGEVFIRVRFPNGSTPNGFEVTNTATITGNGIPDGNSNPVTTEADARPTWTVTKENADGNTIFLDADFTYQITVDDALNGDFGSLNLDSYSLIDTLPMGAVFISASDGGVYDMTAGTVTWNFGNLLIDNSNAVTLTVNFPSANFTEGGTVTNVVDLIGQPAGEPNQPLDTDNISHTLAAPNPSATIDKVLDGNGTFLIGDTIQWDVDLENNGTTPLDNFVFDDTLDSKLELYQITTGRYNNAPTSINISYQTTTNSTFTTYPGSPFDGSTNQTLDIPTDLSLAAGEYITVIRYEFGNIPFGWTATNDIQLSTIVLTNDHNGNPVNIGDQITNTGFLEYEFGGTTFTESDMASGTTRDIIQPSTTMDKIDDEGNVPMGGELNYVMIPALVGDFAMDSIVMIDTIPIQMELDYTESGGWINLNQDVEVYYQTNLNATYQPWTNSPYAPTSDTRLNVSALSLAANEYVTVVKWIFINPQAGFTHDGNRPRVRGLLLEVDRNGVPVMAGDMIENCTYLTGYLNGMTYPSSDCDAATAEDPLVVMDPTKFIVDGGSNVMNAGPFFPGDIVLYEIEAKSRSNSTDTLTNPILMDLLPPEISYIEGSQMVTNNPDGHPAPIFEVIQNYNSTGRTLLRWSWTGASAANFLANDEVQIQFQGTINSNVVAEQIIPNELYQTTNDVPVFECDEASDVDFNDLDGDGVTTDILCKDVTAAEFDIQTVPSLTSEKLVLGQLDTAYSKFPLNGQTVPGGLADYQIILRNKGTVPMTNVVVIDILPFVGDQGVIDLSQRETRWRPNLVAPLSVPAGVIAYYSTAQNPCRDAEGIEPNGPAGCTPPNWSTIPPDDITTVQSFKVDFGDIIINPGDEIVLEYPMRAPADALEGLGTLPDTIAWNSFGYIANRVNPDGSIGASLLPSEPLKTGIDLLVPTKAAYGNFVWFDTDMDGIQDAGEAGINGVTVELYLDNGDGISDPAVDSLVSFTLTANEGLYLFPELDAGDYFAVFYPPNNFTVSPDNNGVDSLDSDGIPTTINNFNAAITAVTNLMNAETDLTWDLGIFPNNLASVGNYVWHDVNQNGQQDEAALDGVNGITVNLYDTSNNLIETTTTQNDLNGNPGYYLFDELTPGDYYIDFTIPNSFMFTTSTSGTASDATDSDAIVGGDATMATTDIFNLSANEHDPTWDAGLILPTGNMSLGNFVWEDTNNDGDYDPATETGLNGIIVNLYEDSDNSGDFTPGVDAFLTTTTTQTSGGNPGHYLFENLAEGNYIVQIDESNFNNGELLFEYTSSTGNGVAPDPDDDQNFDDNGEPLTGNGIVSQAITLTENTEPINDEDTDNNSNLTVDFGVYLCQELVAATLVQSECMNTTGDSADDFFTITVNASTNNGSSQFEVVLNANMDGTGGSVLATSNYGTPITIGDGINGAEGTFVADGATTYEITVRDAAANTCHKDFTTTIVNSCTNAQVDYPDFNRPGFPPCPESPCHVVNQDLKLGTMLSADSPDMGDENATGDDDDGITYPNDLRPGTQIRLQIQVTNNTGSDAHVHGWADWNNDGDFDDANEAFLAATYDNATYNGVYTVSEPLFIPSDASLTSGIAMRFRISSDPTFVNSPCGTGVCAPDGEVEDYIIQLVCPPTICLPSNIQINQN